jgi:hypothetical protein
MTARATFTQAEISRAIRAAKGEGMMAVLTPIGVMFVEAGSITLPSADEGPAEVKECDKAFGLSR